MSSDVYIDIKDEYGIRYSLRIGNFALMSYYGLDIHDWLNIFLSCNPKITMEKIKVILNILDYFRDYVDKELREQSVEDIAIQFRYYPPKEGWDDIISNEEFSDSIKCFVDRTWSIRVD